MIALAGRRMLRIERDAVLPVVFARRADDLDPDDQGGVGHRKGLRTEREVERIGGKIDPVVARIGKTLLVAAGCRKQRRGSEKESDRAGCLHRRQFMPSEFSLSGSGST